MKNKTSEFQGWRYLSLIIALIVVSIQSFAYDFIVDGIYYKITNSATKEVAVTLQYYSPGGRYEDATIISDYTGDVIVPSSVNYEGITYAVTSIDNHAFDDSDVTSVSMPNTIQSIGQSAFAYCIYLKSILIPNGVASISNSTFSGCTGLVNVTIPNSVTSIGDHAFYGCKGLTNITIPNSVTSVGESIFSGSGIKEPVTIGNQLVYCPATYEGTYHIPMGITTLAGGVFSGCTKITKVIIPHGVTGIPGRTFYGCTSLQSVSIPSTVTYVGESSFYDCLAMKECILPPNACTESKYTFYHCESLESFVVPTNTTYINSYAFESCSSLKSITFPEKLWKFNGMWAFSGTPTYIDVYNFADCLQSNMNDPNGLSSYCKIHVPVGWTAKPTYSPISGTLIYDLQAITSISMSKSSTDIAEGATYSLQCTISPSNASVKDLHWSSDNTDVAIVDNHGNVTAISNGTAKITALTLDGSNLAATCNVRVTSLHATIEDGSPIDFVSNTYNTITYARTFNNTNWQPLYVPFSMSFDDWDSQGLEVARLNGFYEYDDDKNGTIDRSALEVLMVTESEGVLKPNHPYVIRAKTTGTKEIVVTNTELCSFVAKSIDCSTVETKYTFTGTTKTISKETLSAMDAYIASGGSLTPSGGNLKPMRWYMTRQSRGGQLLPAFSEVKIFVLGEEDTADGVFVPLFKSTEDATTPTFNLAGQRVTPRAKGVVIRNGKKYLNK